MKDMKKNYRLQQRETCERVLDYWQKQLLINPNDKVKKHYNRVYRLYNNLKNGI